MVLKYIRHEAQPERYRNRATKAYCLTREYTDESVKQRTVLWNPSISEGIILPVKKGQPCFYLTLIRE